MEPIGDGTVTPARAEKGIRTWISSVGHALLSLGPAALLTGMATAALSPVLFPILTGVAGQAAVDALFRQLGGLGAGYLAGVVQNAGKRLKDEAPTAAITEERLREVLQASLGEALAGPEAAKARADLTALVHEVNGVNATLQAAYDTGGPGLSLHLSRVVSDLVDAAEEFHGLREDLLGGINSIQLDTRYLRSTTRDTYDEVCRLNAELAMLRYALMRDTSRRRAAPGSRVVQGSVIPEGDAGAVPLPGGVRPYPGLAAFSEGDAPWFYGRDHLIGKLVSKVSERVYGSAPLIVTGVSGAGKSSVLRAGLIPELRAGGLAEEGSQDWPWITMTPGDSPLRELATLLAHMAGIPSPAVLDLIRDDPGQAPMIVRQGLLSDDERHRTGVVTAAPDVSGVQGTRISRRRLILLIDQFEETFTRCQDGAERKRFVDAICAIATGTRKEPPPALVVVGLHMAFIEHCTAHPELEPALDDSVTIGPMTTRELHEAIERPAVQAGLTVQEGLVATMLRDIGAEESPGPAGLLTYDPGKLPLLAHALLETWKRRAGSMLTIDAYEKAGGIHHALAETAERVYGSLGDAGKEAARRLLMRMVALHEDTEDTRRRMSRTSLLAELPSGDQVTAGTVLDQLEHARLVTAEEDTVQIAHEALLRHWPRLAGWLGEDREWQREERRLAESAHQWDEHGRHPDMLLHGVPLEAVREDLNEDRRAELGELERDFVRASQQRHRRGRRIRTAVIAGLVGLTVVAAGFWADAQYNAAVAGRQQSLAQSRQLVAEAGAIRDQDPEVSLLLSLEAYRVRPSYEAASSLLSAQSGFSAPVTSSAGPVNAVAYDPAAPVLAEAGQGNAVLLASTRTRGPATALRGRSPFYAVAFNQAGTLLAGAEEDGDTVIWNTATRRPAGILRTPYGLSVNAVAFDPAGQIIATAGNDETVRLWDTRTLREIRSVSFNATVNGIAFSRDGTRLAAALSDHTIRVWTPAAAGAGVRVLSGHTGPARAVAFGRTPDSLVSGSDDGTIRIWNVRTGLSSVLSASSSPVVSVAFSPAGNIVASGGADDAVRLWDVTTLTQVGARTGPASTVTGVTFSPDGKAMAASSDDGTVTVWGIPALAQAGSQPVAVAASAPHAGSPVATTASPGARVALWSPGQGLPYAVVSPPPAPSPLAAQASIAPSRASTIPGLALSPDGRTLAVTVPGGKQVAFWATRGARRTGLLPAAGPLTSVAFGPAATPGDAEVAAGSSDGDIYVWPPRAAAPVALAGGFQAPVTSVAFSPDGTVLAAGSDDGTFLLARRGAAGNWKLFAPNGGPLNPVETVAFSPDGKLLATGSQAGTVQLWDISDPARPVQVKELTGPSQAVISVAFSDAGTLAASSDDDTIQVWDVRDPAAPTALATLSGLPNPSGITWTDGSDVITAAADGTMRTWDIRPAAVAARVCASGLSRDGGDISSYLSGISYRPICPGR